MSGKETAQALIDLLQAELDEGSSYMDMMYAAYLRETDLRPEEVALVETTSEDGVTARWFESREQVFARIGLTDD